MAMNPQSVLSQLRMMSDQQLQQYAAMHKNDPFIFPLAFQESQTRKQMRSESQAMQAGPQEKVADQALAAMAPEPLPEEVGIGALPAQNLEGMCGGGIVAFDEGGEVPRYNGATGAGSFVGPQYDFKAFLQSFVGATPEQFNMLDDIKKQELRDTYKQMFVDTAPPSGQTAAASAAPRTPTMTERGIKAIGNVASSAGDYLKRGLGAISKYSPAYMVGEGLFGTSPEELAILRKADQARLGKATGDVLAQYGLDKGMPSPSATQADVNATMGVYAPPPAWASGEPSATGDKGAGPGGSGGKKAPGPSVPQLAAPTAQAAPAMGIADAKKLSGQFIDKEGIMKSVDAFTKMQDEGLAALAKAREEGKPQGKAYEEYERLVKNRVDELASDKETAKGEALLTAGLAVLGGSSPFALQNLSLASKGMEQYRDAMKDIKKATRENEKALADIEQSRRAEGREDWKDAQKFRESAFERRMKGKELGVKAIMDIGVKDGEIASKLYDTSMQVNGAMERTLIQERGQTARTNAMLAAPGQQERLFATLGADPSGPVAQGLGVYSKAMGPDARSTMANRAKAFHDWSTSPILQNQYKNFEDYFRMSGMGGPTTGGAFGASTGNWGTATVVPQPGR